MATAAQNSGPWNALSRQIADAVEAVQESIVTVHGGGRSTSSGVVWRPGVVVTVRQGLRRGDGLQVARKDATLPATLAGVDAGTDLAVLRVASGTEKSVDTTGNNPSRVGELVLAVGRSALGDISASAGILARLGSSWRTFRGGQMDSLIRPDLRLYVGQTGSALINEQGTVLGINSTALARNAVITIPKTTVDRVVDAVLERGHVPRPFLGAAMQAVPIPETLRPLFTDESEQALLILQVEPNGPAATAGISVGDLLFSVNGRPANHVHGVQHQLLKLNVGEALPVTVIRGGERKEVSVILGDRG